MQRPNSLRWFSKLYLGSAVFAFIGTLIFYSDLREWVIARDGAPGVIILLALIDLLIGAALWYFIARRTSRVAKWVASLLATIGLITLVVQFGESLQVGQVFAFIDGVLTVTAWVACSLLFRADAREWFSRMKQPSVQSEFY